MSTALLWLFVLNLGIAFGAGLYEHRIVVSTWVDTSSSSGRGSLPSRRSRGSTRGAGDTAGAPSVVDIRHQ